MVLPHLTPGYEKWAPFIARLILGGAFVMSAYFKIPGTEMFDMQVEMTANAGLPFANVLVILAMLIELVAGIALIVGYQTRSAAAALALLVFIIAFTFFRDLSKMENFASFMSCFELIAGLLYVSVYGAQTVAKDTCPLPHGLIRG